MFTKTYSRIPRFLTAIVLAALLVAFIPQAGLAATSPTQADAATSGPAAGTKPYIEVIAVKANVEITVQAYRFPANQTFKIRIGSFKNFFKDFVVVDSVYSGTGGSFKFNVKLPASVTGVNLVTVRLDSPQKYYAYNVFKNVDSGSVTPTTPPQPTSGTCQILSTTPTKSMGKYEDFDAVWTVKNISQSNWEASSVDYKYVSGTRLHRYNDTYDFATTIKPGETVTIIVDMQAPATVGSYAVNWAIVQGATNLCSLPLSITVK